jgi:hypothetical protein
VKFREDPAGTTKYVALSPDNVLGLAVTIDKLEEAIPPVMVVEVANASPGAAAT